MHSDSIKATDRVAIIDDVLATGGTSAAAVKLVNSLGGKIVLLCYLVELTGLKGRHRLGKNRVYSLLKY